MGCSTKPVDRIGTCPFDTYLTTTKVKLSKLENALSELVQLKRITDQGLGAEPSAAGGYGGLGALPPSHLAIFVIF